MIITQAALAFQMIDHKQSYTVLYNFSDKASPYLIEQLLESLLCTNSAAAARTVHQYREQHKPLRETQWTVFQRRSH